MQALGATGGVSPVPPGGGGGDDAAWTPQQLRILSSLFRTTPKSSLPRAPPVPASLPSKFRPITLPPPRHKPPSHFLPRLAKHKLSLSLLAHHLHRLPPDLHVSSVLDDRLGSLLRGSLSATIRELGRLGNPHRALQTFLWQQQYSHLWPDDRTLHATIGVLAEAGLKGPAWDLLNSRAPNSSLAYQALVHGLIKSGRLEQALHVKDAAESAGCLLDQGVYARLILLASRQNRKGEVCTLAQQLGKFPELRLNLEYCTSVMAACRKAEIYDAVQSLFQWWKSSGFKPNVVMYTIVMTSLSDAGKHRDALAIYWEMERAGCDPDLLAYSVLIRLCSEVGDSFKASRLFARMKEAGIFPTRDVYMNLINVCCTDGRLAKANEFLEAMKLAGMASNFRLEDLY